MRRRSRLLPRGVAATLLSSLLAVTPAAQTPEVPAPVTRPTARQITVVGEVKILEVDTSRGPVNVAWTAFGPDIAVFDPAFPEGLYAIRDQLGERTDRVQAVALSHGSATSLEPPLAEWFAGTVVEDMGGPRAHPAALEVDGELAITRGGVRMVLRSARDLAAPGPALVAHLDQAGMLFAGALGNAPETLDGVPDAGGWRRWADDWSRTVYARVLPMRGSVQRPSWLLKLRHELDAALIAEQSAASRLGSLRGARVALEIDPSDRSPLRILTRPLDDALRQRLAALSPRVMIVEARNRDDARQHAATVHAADASFCDAEFLAAAPELRWIQAWSAGVERYLAVDALREPDHLVLTNMRAMSGAPIADHAFGMLLSLTRSLAAHRDAQTRSAWDRSAGRIHEELAGRTLLVLGLGGIGTACAERGHGFGMRVLAVDVRLEPKPEQVERIVLPDQLDTVLPEADVVMVCVPLTDQTRNLLDARRLALMPRGALLINVARGRVVDTEALLAALDSGRLAGAGLDVTEPEPLPEDHPLWLRKDVVITPHVAGRSQGTDEREAELFVENVRRFVSGEPLLNVVDKQAGY